MPTYWAGADLSSGYFAGLNATWVWLATPGGGEKPSTSLVL